MTKYTILTYVLDRPGVLNKITGLIRRKIYNIDSLTVSKTTNPDISAMTMTLRTDDIARVNLMMKQIEKLPEVISIRNLDPEKSFWREIALIKCQITDSKLEVLIKEYDMKLLFEDKESNTRILQIAGRSRDIDACLSEISNVIDVTRSGVTSMEIEDNGLTIIPERVNAGDSHI